MSALTLKISQLLHGSTPVSLRTGSPAQGSSPQIWNAVPFYEVKFQHLMPLLPSGRGTEGKRRAWSAVRGGPAEPPGWAPRCHKGRRTAEEWLHSSGVPNSHQPSSGPAQRLWEEEGRQELPTARPRAQGLPARALGTDPPCAAHHGCRGLRCWNFEPRVTVPT